MRSSRKRSHVRRPIRIAAGLVFALAVGLQIPASAHHDEIVDKLEAGVTERVSISSSGEEGNGDSGASNANCGDSGTLFSASDNGRFVAFLSEAGNLHPADINGSALADIFVYDRKKEKLDLVSALPTGLAAHESLPTEIVGFQLCPSTHPRISGNGRYVAFASLLPLTGSDDPLAAGRFNVFVRDLRRGETFLVSRWRGGSLPDPNLANSGSLNVSISDDGHRVAFDSSATGLTDDGACLHGTFGTSCQHFFVTDWKRDETVLVSRSSDGEPGNGPSSGVISGNGRFVAFQSTADNLVPGDVNACWTAPTGPSCWDVFRHDLDTGKTELVSISRDGGSADDASRNPQISDDGRFVTFGSAAKNLVPSNISPHPFCSGGYARDMETGRTERVTVTSTGAMLSGGFSPKSITDSGRYVAFDSWQNYSGLPLGGCWLRPTEEAHESGGSVIDRATGQVDRRTFYDPSPEVEAPEGTRFQIGVEQFFYIGGNGRFLVGTSDFDNMVENDSNEATDVFLRELGRSPLGSAFVAGEGASSRRSITMPSGTRIGPDGAAVLDDASGDALLDGLGAEILQARIAHRPDLDDLYVKIDVGRLATSTSPAGVLETGMLYGARFTIDDNIYELRAQGLGGPLLQGEGMFGLFECPEVCSEIAELKGGYGTVGENVVASIPLRHLGLEDGGQIADIELFAGPGSYLLGLTRLLDMAGS